MFWTILFAALSASLSAIVIFAITLQRKERAREPNPRLRMGTRVLLRSGEHSGHRECTDCAHFVALVSWWCGNAEACDKRGTAIPDATRCPFWAPCPKKSEMTSAQLRAFEWLECDGVPTR